MDASPPRRRSRPPSPPSEATVSLLAPEILEKVVSLLSLREAVRTSAVSRAWRRLWESAPGLALEWSYGADPVVVDAVLARYSRPVRSFWIHLRAECFWRANGWIPLAGRGVQALRLHFSRGRDVDPHSMDASMFTCRELTLDLVGCDIPAAPPELAGFPNLTKLYLSGVGFPDTGVKVLEALIAESPLLQLLWLDDLWFPGQGDDDDYVYEEWFIQAPNLRNLRIHSEDDYEWQMAELPSIEEVDISFNSYIVNRDFVELLTTLAPARKLDLKMLIWYDNVEQEEVGADLLNAQWAEGVLGNLKCISMYLATCQPNEMHFIQFVLSKARRLQKFDICVNEYCPKSNEELLVERLKYRRSSPQAKVFSSAWNSCKTKCVTCKLPLVAFSPWGKC